MKLNRRLSRGRGLFALIVSVASIITADWLLQQQNFPGGGGASSNTANGAISPLNTGGKFDVRYESDCTFNTTTTVVCPSGHFTAADVGKIEFGTNALQTHGSGSLIAAPVIVPQGTISSVTNATTVVVSVIANANCTPSATNLCWFAWGTQDDTTALATAQTAAWNNGPCLTLQMPAGAAFISKGGLGALGLSQGNSCTGATDFNQAGPELAGMGQGATVLIPLPSFDFTTCTNGANANSCFGGAGALRAHDFQINGLGQTLNATTHANNLFEINGVTTFWNAAICTGGSAANLRLAGWGLLSTNLVGLTVNGACDADLVNVTNEDFGNELCHIDVTSNVTSNVSATGLVCFGGNTTSLHTLSGGGTFTSSGGYYGSCLGSACNNWLIDNTSGTGIFNSSSDVVFGQGTVTQNIVKVNSAAGNARVNLWGDGLYLPTTTLGTSQVFLANGAGSSTTTLTSTTMVSTGVNNRTFVTTAGNNIQDIGGNTFTNGSVANSITGGFFGTYSSVGTACAIGNFALTSGWGTSSVTSVAANGNLLGCHVTITGAAGAAGPVLTWTYPQAPPVAPGSCHIVGVSGTLTGVTVGTPGAANVAFTFAGTPSAQTYVFDVGCP